MLVMVAIPIVPTVFFADVVAVNPMMPGAHVSGDPNHLIVTVPIAWPMIVVGPIADLNFNIFGSNRRRYKNARHHNGGEQKFAFDHPSTDHAPMILANTVLVVRNTFSISPSILRELLLPRA